VEATLIHGTDKTELIGAFREDTKCLKIVRLKTQTFLTTNVSTCKVLTSIVMLIVMPDNCL
jgi:hypothetical protein